MPIVDLNEIRYVHVSALIEWLPNLTSYSGIARDLSQQDPMPELEAAPPVATANDDKDGEDVAGPTVEARVELAKTISK